MQDEIFKDYGMEPKPGLGNMWANINYPGSYNKQHMHPNSQWSGVYYVKVPKNSGSYLLKIQDQVPILCYLDDLKEYPEPYGAW